MRHLVKGLSGGQWFERFQVGVIEVGASSGPAEIKGLDWETKSHLT